MVGGSSPGARRLAGHWGRRRRMHTSWPADVNIESGSSRTTSGRVESRAGRAIDVGPNDAWARDAWGSPATGKAGDMEHGDSSGTPGAMPAVIDAISRQGVLDRPADLVRRAGDRFPRRIAEGAQAVLGHPGTPCSPTFRSDSGPVRGRSICCRVGPAPRSRRAACSGWVCSARSRPRGDRPGRCGRTRTPRWSGGRAPCRPQHCRHNGIRLVVVAT